jgi:hypothetical protein
MSSKYAVCSLFALLIPVAFTQTAFAQTKDLLLGKWELDRGKSDFQPDTTLQTRTLTVEAAGKAVKFFQDTVLVDGHSVQVEFTAAYDDKDVPITNSVLDTVALKRVNPTTVVRTGKTGGKATETASLVVSDDGKVLTFTTKGSGNGVEYGSTQVFHRQ